MLVLTRQLDEAIEIGDSIRVTVVRIDSNKVRLGIDAPRDVPIRRLELIPQALRQEARDDGQRAA